MTDIVAAVEAAMPAETANTAVSTVEDEIHVPEHVDPFAGFEDEAAYNGPQDDMRSAVEKAFDEVKATGKVEKADTSTDGEPKEAVTGKDVHQSTDKARAEGDKVEKPVRVEKDDKVEAKGDASTAAKPADGRVPEVDRQSEGRKYAEAPARFLPKSREVWANVPNAVKADFHRISQEFDNEVAAYKQTAQSYEEIRQFDEMARSAGTNLKTALSNYVQLETLLRNDPIAGVSAVLSAVGLTPNDYVSRISGQYNSAQPQALPGQRNPNYDGRLEQQISNLSANFERYQQEAETRAKHDAINNNVVAPFAREATRYNELEGGIISFLESDLVPHNMSARDRLEAAYSCAEFEKDAPRYKELKQDIDLFLQSGRIPHSLSARERIEAAYDMAERINPLSVSDQPQTPDSIPESRPVNLDGKKSIRGSATPGKSRSVPNGFRVDTVEDAVRAAMARLIP